MQDLSIRSKDQREKDIAYLAQLALKDLRKRQDLVDKQKSMCYRNYILAREGKVYEAGGSVSKWDAAGNNLDLMRADLDEAVDRRAFGKSRKRK